MFSPFLQGLFSHSVFHAMELLNKIDLSVEFLRVWALLGAFQCMCACVFNMFIYSLCFFKIGN